MLTVNEALQMPVFASSKVVAGHEGLDNQINWVHIIDIPDAHYEWKREGILLLTAGFGLRDDPQRQATLIPKLVEQGFAGMVLSTGYYFEQTPQVIRETADQSGFPVIETPRDVLFIDVTEAVLEHIVNRQYALLQQSTRIHAQLTELVLQGEDLNALATTLATLLQRSVTIEDASFRVLAAAQHGPVDEARVRAVRNGRTTPEVAQHLLDAGVYKQLLQEMEPIRLPPIPDLGMEMERFVVPIIVGREIHGYIWILSANRPLTDLDELTISHGATVAALILFKEQAVREAEEALRDDFFEQLLAGEVYSIKFSEQARRLRYRLHQPHQVLVIHGTPEAGSNHYPLMDHVTNWLDQQGLQAFLVWRDRRVVLVLENGNTAVGKQVASLLVKALRHPTHHILIGVGQVCEPVNEAAEDTRRSYEEAREAVGIGLMLDQREGVIVFSELGLLHWLYHLPAEKQNGNIYLRYIDDLVAYDNKRHTELVKTLEAYLDHGGSLVEAAQVLYIHRNTLLHRLQRIEQLCPVDIRDPMQCLNLHVAVKAYRLKR